MGGMLGVVVGVVLIVAVRLVLTDSMLKAWLRQDLLKDDASLELPPSVETVVVELERRGFVRVATFRAAPAQPPSLLALGDPEERRTVAVTWTASGRRTVVSVTSGFGGDRTVMTTSGLVFLSHDGLVQAFPMAAVGALLARHDTAEASATGLGLSTQPVPSAEVAARVRAAAESGRVRLAQRRQEGFGIVADVAWRTAFRRSRNAGAIAQQPDAMATLRAWAASPAEPRA